MATSAYAGKETRNNTKQFCFFAFGVFAWCAM